jgi:hypothetical protein
MSEHNWDDDTAIAAFAALAISPAQLARQRSAESYLRLRLAGENRDEAAEHEIIRQQADLMRARHPAVADLLTDDEWAKTAREESQGDAS